MFMQQGDDTDLNLRFTFVLLWQRNIDSICVHVRPRIKHDRCKSSEILPAGFGKLDRPRRDEWAGSLEANIVGIFSFAPLQRGKIHELVCHFSTFPADAATREFFLQTCEYRSESCYITGSPAPLCSAQAWMYAASLLMERFSSAPSCSVGKTSWLRRWRWGSGGDCFPGSGVVARMKLESSVHRWRLGAMRRETLSAVWHAV